MSFITPPPPISHDPDKHPRLPPSQRSRRLLWRILCSIVLGGGLLGAILWQLPVLMSTLGASSLTLSRALNLASTLQSHSWQAPPAPSLPSFALGLNWQIHSPAELLWTYALELIGVGAFLGLTKWSKTPILRVLYATSAALLSIGIALFALLPNSAPLNPAQHTHTLSQLHAALLLCLPPLLAGGHYLADGCMANRLVASVLIIGTHSVLFPLKLTLHLALVALISPAVLPLLFILNGVVFDLMLCIALYTWSLSWPSFCPHAKKASPTPPTAAQ